ncbi:heparan-alpha-glucosaminide N-acetyltransferase domain-containing protein [Brachybacterium sp. UNK5269]|uniref:heparan-alpha-glucosaminide N-acetyltransferase domain-containing protein n=1 Tax=Brachybacterium sp. UNK5269 TaxID=3408576 RepID=UPI003BB1A4BC
MSSAVVDRSIVEAPAPGPGPGERLRRLVSPPRINALDAARALAILGMIGAHVGNIPPFDPSAPLSYLSVVHGHSSLLFAVLAGISIALMTGRTRLPEPAELPGLRLGLLGRGATIFVIGLMLEMLGTGVAVILAFYGIMYVAAMPVLRLRPSRLILLAALIALVGPLVVTVAEVLSLGVAGEGAYLVLIGVYRFTAWAPLMLVGMALGRLPLERRHVAAAIAGVGAGLAVVGTIVGMLAALSFSLLPSFPGSSSSWDSSVSSGAGTDSSSWVEEYDEMVPAEQVDITGMVCYPPYPGDPTVYCEPPGYAQKWMGEESSWQLEGESAGWETYPEQLGLMDPWWMIASSLVSPDAHSGSTVEIIRSAGLSMLVIGVLLLVARPLRWLLLPLSALGAMPLTAYSAHVLALFALLGPGGWMASNLAWLLMSAVLIALCLAWSAFRGRGPLERVTAWSARRARGPLLAVAPTAPGAEARTPPGESPGGASEPTQPTQPAEPTEPMEPAAPPGRPDAAPGPAPTDPGGAGR